MTLTIVTATRSLPSALREKTLSPYLLFQFVFNDFILSGAILFGTFAMKCPSCWYTEMHFNSDTEFRCVTQLSYNSDVPLSFIAKLTELVFSGSSLLCPRVARFLICLICSSGWCLVTTGPRPHALLHTCQPKLSSGALQERSRVWVRFGLAAPQTNPGNKPTSGPAAGTSACFLVESDLFSKLSSHQLDAAGRRI